MSEVKIGKLIDSTCQRDAIHVAIAPAKSAVELHPGQRVTVGTSGVIPDNVNPVGIVDPFLTHTVKPGAMFYIFLMPGTATGMRYHWTHPRFADNDSATDSEAEKAAAIEWMQAAAGILGVSYDSLISPYSDLVMGHYIDNGENIRDSWYDLADDYWKYRKIITGEDVPEKRRGGFTCSPSGGLR